MENDNCVFQNSMNNIIFTNLFFSAQNNSHDIFFREMKRIHK